MPCDAGNHHWTLSFTPFFLVVLKGAPSMGRVPAERGVGNFCIGCEEIDSLLADTAGNEVEILRLSVDESLLVPLCRLCRRVGRVREVYRARVPNSFVLALLRQHEIFFSKRLACFREIIVANGLCEVVCRVCNGTLQIADRREKKTIVGLHAV